MFHILYAFVWLITWLPLGVLYVFSDFIYYLVYYLIRYRRNVVRQNLENSFPLKSKQELRKLERQFYHFFCDVFIETIYEMHMSNDEMRKRMNFVNADLILEQYAKGKSCLLMTAHYGNWEWACAFSLWLPKDKPLYGIYKQLSNTNFDWLMCQLRMTFNGKNIEKDLLLRKMVELRKEGQLAMFGMISDQSPPGHSIHFWTKFLNQDTAPLSGTELLARKFDYPVFYTEIKRVKRGYYNCEFIPVSMEPKLSAENEITESYIRLLEKSILSAPQYWLWTHKRWKHNRS